MGCTLERSVLAWRKEEGAANKRKVMRHRAVGCKCVKMDEK
jgi:hypothetical protein